MVNVTQVRGLKIPIKVHQCYHFLNLSKKNILLCQSLCFNYSCFVFIISFDHSLVFKKKCIVKNTIKIIIIDL